MDLTEKEKKYCEYVFLEQAKSVKLGLGIVGVIAFIFLAIICIPLALYQGGAGRFATLITVGIFAIIIFPLFIWKSKTYDFMYKDLLDGRYEVFRTTVEKKMILKTTKYISSNETLESRNSVSGICFRCHNFDGNVFPLSMDLVPAAKEGVEITIVRFPSYGVPLGIIMSEEFDKKISQWEEKNQGVGIKK